MTNHMSAAYAGVVKAMKKMRKSGKTRITTAKRHANGKLRGAGGNKAMLKGAALYLANHPNSKNAQKMVKRAVKMA